MATKTVKKVKGSVADTYASGNPEAHATSNKGKQLSGVVTSDKMKDTVVVSVNRFVKHPKYGKFLNISKKYKAHDAGNTKKIGDKVTIQECAPISKDKHFKII